MRSSPSHRGAVATAARQAIHFDHQLVSVSGGLLAAIPFGVVLGAGIALGDPVPAVTMGAGAMLVGIAWRTTGGRPPIAVMAIDALVMALSTFMGCLTGPVLWLHLIVLCLWGLGGGLLVGVGNRGGAVGTQAIIAVVVFGRFPEPVGPAAALAAAVLAGGAAQVIFLSLVRWPLPLRGQRVATASAFRALAALARADDAASSLPAAAALDDAQASLASSSLFADAAVMTLRSLVSEGQRLRVVLTALHALHAQAQERKAEARIDDGPRARSQAQDPGCLALATAGEALSLAAGVIGGDPRARQALEQRVAQLSAAADTAESQLQAGDPATAVLGVHLARRLQALAGQLRAVAALAPAAGRAGGLRSRRPQRRADQPLARLRTDLAQLRANISWSSPPTRHALRLAVIVPAVEVLARELPLQRGYWIVVAAATVLRPEFGATWTRGTERALGTSLGVALAGALTVALHPAGGVTILLVFLLAWGGYAVFPASFAVGFAFITALVVFLLNAISPDTLAIASARLLDTLIGGAIGLVAYAAWPTWAQTPAWQALVNLIEAEQRYLTAIFDALIAGRRATDRQMRPLSRAVRLARTNAEAIVARSLSEPESRRIDPHRSQGMLGAMRRLVQAAHILRLDLEEERDRRPVPELAPLRQGLDELLSRVVSAVGSAVAQPDRPPDLRERYGVWRRTAGEGTDALLLAPQLDEIVDATNGLAELAGVIAPPSAAADDISGTDPHTRDASATMRS